MYVRVHQYVCTTKSTLHVAVVVVVVVVVVRDRGSMCEKKTVSRKLREYSKIEFTTYFRAIF